ncbi:SNARE-interacting protein KEULE isoform X5 [Physcomitrium patens]|uniref:SNARE-interacting protein KEULE isoform X5 n=1 Tax=Physcomitrium patens TaxID=3218 RepID=UPI000D160F0D|nr:SNARE-interacting protein KEULE-like isoform X6 [Physcomitrium patens]|eukprot:XP_024398648.1 SNARE-interacting protein KEULE-like isoform X6 [Physcomitrella patens]
MADLSSSRSVYRSFKQILHDRLLKDMLHTVRTTKQSTVWKVLVMDEITVKVMSSSCKMTEITEEGISLVENIGKSRQPLPALDAVYFIQPSQNNVESLIGDMSGKAPRYKRAFVFFSSPVPRNLLNTIKSEASVLARVAVLREVNVEFLTIDTQGFTTDHDKALEHLFGDHGADSRDYELCVESMAIRLSTVFASLKEFPHVRYRAPNPHAGGSDSKVTARDFVPTRLAAALWDCLMKFKATLSDFPIAETCELVIVDRRIDPVAPIMHEWTYDAMCNDLLDIDGSKYTYEVTTSSGKKERKEVLLADNDPIWMEIRDLHIADASLQLTEKMQEFGKKNEAAQLRLNNKEGQEISTKEMQKLVQALPQFQDQIDKLSLHIHGMSQDNKLRLLLIYAATHPDKLDTAKRLQWTKLAKLSGEDMNTITNLECLGVSLSKKQPEGFSLQFRPRKVSIRPTRKEKNQDEMGWQLSRFYPLIEDVVAELGKNGLPKEQYPYVKLPVSLVGEASVTGQPASAVPLKKPHSVRTIRYNWAAAGKISVGSASSDSGSSTNEPTITGTRIFVFIVGGMTRSELRTMRKLTAQLKREVIIGSTSLDNPQQFLQKLRSLTTIDDID